MRLRTCDQLDDIVGRESGRDERYDADDDGSNDDGNDCNENNTQQDVGSSNACAWARDLGCDSRSCRRGHAS